MKERPIIFSTKMVKAILDGRKTQTRRAIKNICIYSIKTDKDGMILWRSGPAGNYKRGYPGDDLRDVCPYGQLGDRLWVKEVYNTCGGKAFYRADGELHKDWKWCSPIFMPHQLSRLTLEITGVQVERLQDISEEDAEKEGAHGYTNAASPIDFFISLWDSLNAKRGFGWETSPWVWAISFKRIEGRKA